MVTSQRFTVCLLLLMSFTLALAGCGSSESAADTFILNIDSAGNVTYTETDGPDPKIAGAYITSSPPVYTEVGVATGHNASLDEYDFTFTLDFGGNTKGTYSDISTNIQPVYITPEEWYLPDNGAYTSASLVVAQYGAVGGRIKGTYSTTLCSLTAILADACDNAANLMSFTGSFDVTREPDM